MHPGRSYPGKEFYYQAVGSEVSALLGLPFEKTEDRTGLKEPMRNISLLGDTGGRCSCDGSVWGRQVRP